MGSLRSEETGVKRIDAEIKEQFNFMEDDHYDLGSEEGKHCSKCNKVLPLPFFSRHSGGNYLRPECKKCNNELSRGRAALKDVHGVAPNNYKCPICLGNADDVKGKGNTKNGSWVIDHCHDTEKFRGWLCHKCNRSLGGFDDNIPTLKRAIQYLKGTDNE